MTDGASAGRLAEWGRTNGALVALALLVIGNALFTPRFASEANFWNVLIQVSTTVLVAMGMTLVIATGGIDLSVGSIMAIASVVAATSLDSGAAAAIALGLLASLAIGACNGALVTGVGIQPFIVTLAMMITGRGIAQVMSHEGELIPFSNAAFESLGKGRLGPVPAPVLMMVLAVAATYLVMRVTSFGRYVLAVGGNEAAARLAGVEVGATRLAVYAASGLLAGVAGLIETARLGTTDSANVGLNMELDAIAAVVVGGTPLSGGRAHVFGTVVGALTMVVITTSFNMLLVPYAWSLIVKAAIILLAVYFQRPRTA